MTSIQDFVDHRWADAKEELRKVDPDFVSKLENAVRLQNIGLEPPWIIDSKRKSRRSLPAGWHRLLEACVELLTQATYLHVAAASLTAEASAGLQSYEAGPRIDYHIRSWFIHGVALAERTNDAIRKTTNVYLPGKAGNEIGKRYQERVQECVSKPLEENRHTFVHPRRSWARAITNDESWEGMVATGMTAAKFLEEFYYPRSQDRVMEGRYEVFATETEEKLARIGAILQECETELTSGEQ